MAENPWDVDSVQVFWYLKCPECIFDTREEENFRDHAFQNHPLSFVFFGKKLKEESLEIKQEHSEDNTEKDLDDFNDYDEMNESENMNRVILMTHKS